MLGQHFISNPRFVERRGATIVFFALAATSIFALVGLVLDGGHGLFERRRAQAAADAGAYGGALELLHNNADWVEASAKNDTALNGFNDDDADVTITVNNPPLSGPSAGDAAFVEVIVEREMPTTFMYAVGKTAMTVSARAVAGVDLDYGNGCILALNATAPGAITISGTSNLNAPKCDVVTNSTANDALVANGGGCIAAKNIAYGTGVGTPGGFVANGQNCLSPQPVGAIPTEDPYAYLSTMESSLSLTNSISLPSGLKLTGNEVPQADCLTAGYYCIEPGRYKGGISITGGTIELRPGLYVVDGFTVTANVTLKGHGVTIYNTGLGNGQIKINGGAQLDLIAPTEGDYQNILFWNSSSISCTSNPNQCDAIINGTADSTVDGVLYFPTVQLTYAGVENSTGFTQIIADTLKITGTAQVGTNWEGAVSRTPTTTRVVFSE